MAETIKVNPTPIQRNKFDVAMELTSLQMSRLGKTEPDTIENLFAKFYALAQYCETKSVEASQELLNDELLEKVGRYKTESLADHY